MIFAFEEDDDVRSFAFPIAEARLERVRAALKHDWQHGFEDGALEALVEEWRPEHVRASHAHRTRVDVETFEEVKDKLLATLPSSSLRAMFEHAIGENLPPRDGFVHVPTAVHQSIEQGLRVGLLHAPLIEQWLEELAGEEHDFDELAMHQLAVDLELELDGRPATEAELRALPASEARRVRVCLYGEPISPGLFVDRVVPTQLVECALHYAIGPYVSPLPRKHVPEAMGESVVSASWPTNALVKALVPDGDIGWRIVRGLDGHAFVIVCERDPC